MWILLKFLVSIKISTSSSLEPSLFSFLLSSCEAFNAIPFFFSSFSTCFTPLYFIVSSWVRSFPISTLVERVERFWASSIEVTRDSQSFLGRILRILLFTSSLEKYFPSFLRVVRRVLRNLVILVINSYGFILKSSYSYMWSWTFLLLTFMFYS